MSGGNTSVYALQQPVGGPDPPDCWSWSGLQSWRRCPRQWWLTRAHYANASTPYPKVTNASAIEGVLVHHAIELFGIHANRAIAEGMVDDQEIRRSFPARRLIQDKLRELIRDAGDVRSDLARVAAGVSIDGCVNAFRGVASTVLKERLVQTKISSTPRSSAKTLRYGAEVTMRVDEPPLCGRLDYVTPNGIVDFKTGGEDTSHANQLRFYAMMFWLLAGEPPRSLKIRYVHEDRDVDIPVPTANDLRRASESCGVEIAAILGQLTDGSAPARPTASNCRMCSVRQLCDTYWTASETECLRLTDKTTMPSARQRLWIDVDLKDLPSFNHVGGLTGIASAQRFGQVRVNIGPSRAIVGIQAGAIGARILNAFVESRSDDVLVGLSSASEIFWLSEAEV